MSEIKINKDHINGPPDGIVADINAVITVYETKKGEGRVATDQNIEPCSVLCSYLDGTISFLRPESDTMMTLRLDEVLTIIAQASETSLKITNEKNMKILTKKGE